MATLFNYATAFIKHVEPKWDLAALNHPWAVESKSQSALLLAIEKGDQIMVRTSAGYWHHGIFAGTIDGEVYVVDVWGIDAKTATISTRPYDTFVADATGFAKANYPQQFARSKTESLDNAKKLMKIATDKGFVYDIESHNCEHFATTCRVGMWVLTHTIRVHRAIHEHLCRWPAPTRRQPLPTVFHKLLL